MLIFIFEIGAVMINLSLFTHSCTTIKPLYTAVKGSQKSSLVSAGQHYCKFNNMTRSDYGLVNLPRVLIPTGVWHYLVSEVHTDLTINGISARACGWDGTSGTIVVILVILQLFGAHYSSWSKENRLGDILRRSIDTFCEIGLPINSLWLALHPILSSISFPPSEGKNLTSP